MSLKQADRLIRMTKGPLGPDEVLVTSFSGQEAISRPFSFELEFVSSKLDLKPGQVVGEPVALELDRRDEHLQPVTPRYFHGYINRFAAGDVVLTETGEYKYRNYRAEVVPWLWFLTQTSRCYLFFPEKEDKSIYEVIEAVFDRAKSDLHIDPVADLQGISDLKNRKVKHCVQYRETDFNFVSRTMEKYGVFYYFTFEDGKHTMVLDMKKNYPACEEAEVMFPRLVGERTVTDHITEWKHDYEFVSGKWSQTDYNFEEPSTSLKVSVPKLESVDLSQNDKYEIYDYPGEYAVKSDGDGEARVRQEEEEVPHSVAEGESSCRTFTAGHTFKLASHPHEDAVSEHGQSYLLTSIQHSASQPSEAMSEAGEGDYTNQFTCVGDAVQFRPERVTPKPVISGVQTAVVVGPAGEEIFTDEYGRVKVQFHWDREGKKDGNSSCWIRVSHPWAGKGWGAVSTPRIGQEVVVDFLEGDPDRPLITGRVYNAEHLPPFGFPAGAVVSGIKSDTHKGDGYNEMAFDDTAGAELIRIHGQYDMDTVVEHDQRSTIHNNRTDRVDVDDSESVGNNQSLDVGVNRTKSVGSNETITVGSNRSSSVGANETATVAMQRTHSVGVNETISVGAAQEITVGGLQAITVGAMQTISVGGNQTLSSGASQTLNAGSNQSTNVGNKVSLTAGGDESRTVGGKRVSNVSNDDTLTVGKNLVINVADSIAISTGDASITMKKDGTIEIKGKDIEIDGSGKVKIKAAKDVIVKGSKVLHN